VRPHAAAVDAEADPPGERDHAQEVDGHEREPGHVVDRLVLQGQDGREDGARDAERDQQEGSGPAAASARSSAVGATLRYRR
jgi:hypothetical protein